MEVATPNISEENTFPTQKLLKWPVWRHDEKFYVSVKNVTSATAMWAIQQSPYAYPEKLTEALDALAKRFTADHEFTASLFTEVTVEGIRQYLCKVFEDIPEIEAWNRSKIETGAKYLFTDRYSEVNPDHDFIDLGALARNIAHTLGREHFY